MDKRNILTFGFMIICLSLSAQDKVERERRVGVDNVPKPAVEWLKDAFEGQKKVQWYEEQSAEDLSYEAKFDWEKKFYSVEFDREGQIEDIEIVQHWKDLPENVQNGLTKYFEDTFSRYRMEKIQLQYTGSSDDLEDLMDEDEFEDITIRYELEYYGVNEEGKHIWEGLFDAGGTLIEQRKIVQRPSDNLNY